MKPNKTKQRLREGKQVVGTLVFGGDPAIVEVAGRAGLDFVIIDMEHSVKDTRTVVDMIRAAATCDVTPLVRVRNQTDPRILNILDAGAQGIVFPLLETAKEARAANNLVKYPPAGARGSCTITSAANYGGFRNSFAEYQQRSNHELLLVGLIETELGVKNIVEILDEGVDVAILGRVDLATSMGVPGDFSHPRVVDACRTSLTAAKNHSGEKWAGTIPYGVPEMRQFAEEGYSFFVYSADLFILRQAFEHFAGSVPNAAPGGTANAALD